MPYSASSLLCYIHCEHLFLILRNRLSLPGSLRGKPFPDSRGANLHPGCRGKRRLQVSCTIAFIAYVGCCSGIPSCRPPSRPRKGRGCYSYCPVLSRHAEILFLILKWKYVKVRFVVNRWGIEPRPLWGLALKLRPSIFLSVCRACTPGDNSYICRT